MHFLNKFSTTMHVFMSKYLVQTLLNLKVLFATIRHDQKHNHVNIYIYIILFSFSLVYFCISFFKNLQQTIMGYKAKH